MAPLLQSETSGSNSTTTNNTTPIVLDARRAALEEAASVLRAVSLSSSAGGIGIIGSDNGNHHGSSSSSSTNNHNNGGASPTKKGAAATIKEEEEGTGTGGGVDAPQKLASPKLSRSDAVAAAKRRAEERKRVAKGGGSGGGAASGTTTTSSSSVTTTTAPGGAPAASPSSSPSRMSRPNNNTNTVSSTNQLDWFNLLGVVTNPSGQYYDGFSSSHLSASSPSSSSHHHLRSRHGVTGGLSSHGTPISSDHVGSGSTANGTAATGGGGGGDEPPSAAGALLAAAGLPTDWSRLADASASRTNATLTSVASQLDEFTGWFDHYSRKYLGTIDANHPVLGEYLRETHGDYLDGEAMGVGAGLSGMSSLSSAAAGYGTLGAMMSNLNSLSASRRHLSPEHPPHPSLMLEYEPEFGADDLPESQLEELPEELRTLDLASVEGFLRRSGMLGMRFEDRGGGFRAVRERRKRIREDERKKKKNTTTNADGDESEEEDEDEEEKTRYPALPPSTAAAEEASNNDNYNHMMASVEETVPEIFFSPYFDLTDPVCFEDLLVISDEEVAQIREREAELHALADRKVREAEEVAKMDAENENVTPRPPPRKPHGDNTAAEAGEAGEGDAADDGGELASGAASGTSLSREARTSSTPAADGSNVITLRKPETFTSHLDAVELVLLDQVRSKSERFFRETNRFSELQRLVSDSVDEVRDLRTELHSIRERCVTNVEVVPIMDGKRRDLRCVLRVLEAVEDVANCKASIASLMGAGDHLGAVEAIRLARELLAESPPEEEESDEEEEEADDGEGRPADQQQRPPPSSPSKSQSQHHHLSLGKLKALSKVGEQLNEYEKLVVQNLTNELVETFLSWGTDNVGNASLSNNHPPRISLTTDRRNEIRGVVKALRVCGKLSGAGAAYKKKLCELISVTVRAIVTECVADAAKNSPGGAGGGAVGGGAADAVTSSPAAKGTMAGVASMSLDQFFDCINMLFEQVLGLLWGAFAVNKFCIEEGFILDDAASAGTAVQGNATMSSSGGGGGGGNSSSGDASARSSQHAPSATAAALAAAADLSEKSVSELLRLRREAHSLVSFDGMRRLWDTSLTFTHRLEKFSGRKAYGLRSTLLAQAKSFVERKHEANMSALVAALDSERWVQCNVSAERQAALTRLCSGRAAFSSRKTSTGTDATTGATSSKGATASTAREKMADAEVEGTRYKVVWSCLLLLEMVMDDVACAAHFQTLAANVVAKVAELLRLFNTRSTHLVLGAGAIHGAARLKSINAKHLAIVTQCIALVLAILPHVRAALMAQLPAKQHALLYDLDKIKADYKEHSEKILSKLVSIIGGIVEHSLAPRIANTDFDARAEKALESNSLPDDTTVECCLFLDNVVTNTRKMHQVLLVMLPAELLRDVFSRIFAYLDHKVPSLFKTAAATKSAKQQKKIFSMPTTDDGKLQMIKEVEFMAMTLNGLTGVQPWNFTAMKILEQELDISRETSSPAEQEEGEQHQSPALAEEESKPTTTLKDEPDTKESTQTSENNEQEAGSAEEVASSIAEEGEVETQPEEGKVDDGKDFEDT